MYGLVEEHLVLPLNIILLNVKIYYVANLFEHLNYNWFSMQCGSNMEKTPAKEKQLKVEDASIEEQTNWAEIVV